VLIQVMCKRISGLLASFFKKCALSCVWQYLHYAQGQSELDLLSLFPSGAHKILNGTG